MGKAKEIGTLQEILKQRDIKLAEAQNAQADLIKKQRELDDAKRELELNIEKRVQANLGVVRDKARKEAEEGLKLKVMERGANDCLDVEANRRTGSAEQSRGRNSFKAKSKNLNSKPS